MNWRTARRIASILNKEKIYSTYKGKKLNVSEIELIKLMKLDKILLLTESIMIVSLVLPVISLPILLSTSDTLIQNLRVSMVFYNTFMFTVVFMAGSTSIWTLQEFRFLNPLLQLPIETNDFKKIVFLNLFHDISLVLVIPPIYGIVVAEKMKLPQAFLLVVLYGCISVFLATGLSMLSSSLIGLKRKIGSGFKSKITTIFRNLVFIASMFFIGILWEIYTYMNFLFEFTGESFGVLFGTLWFIYPFSAAEGIIMSTNFNGFMISLFICLIYLVISKKIFDKAFVRFMGGAVQPIYKVTHEVTKLSVPKAWISWNPLNIAIKDIKIIFRDPRPAYIIVLPLFVVIGYLPTIVGYMSYIEFRANICNLSMTLFMVGCIISSLAPYQLLEYESGKMWLLFSSGASKKELALSKSIITTVSYMSYAMPMGIISSFLIQDVSLFIYATSGLITSFAISLLSIFTAIPQMSTDTKMIRLTLIRAIMLVIMSTSLSLPLILPIQFINLKTAFHTFSKESLNALLASIMEFTVVFLIFDRLVKD